MKVSEEQICNMNLPSLLYTVQAQPWKPLVVKKRDLRCSRATARLSAVHRKIYGCQYLVVNSRSNWTGELESWKTNLVASLLNPPFSTMWDQDKLHAFART